MADTRTRPAAATTPRSGPPAGPGSGGPRRMTTGETLRWAWRQLTSMRTALVLLFLLALAAVPGSVIPQRNSDTTKVLQFATDHPELARWYDRLDLFAVYRSPWFAAVYLLLFASLVGCIVPRTLVHARALRSRSTLTPRVLARLPAHAAWTTDADPAAVLRGAEQVLGRRRFLRPGTTLSVRTDPLDPVAAERGRLRETGNLLFHVALLVVLAGVAGGALLGYRGTTLVVEGQGFTNGPLAYSDLTTGALLAPTRLPPFTVTLSDFQASFWADGPAFGTAKDFRGTLAVTDADGGPARTELMRLNHPVSVDGARISLLGNGYAPVVTVRDPAGAIRSQGPVVFFPQDLGYTSAGVLKVAPAGSAPGLEIAGSFLPSAAVNSPVSAYPDLVAPQLRLTAYHGTFSLGGGSGSVYTFDQGLLDAGTLKQYRNGSGQPLSFSLSPGGSFTLPDGDTVSFDGIRRWANLQVDHDPSSWLVLGGAGAAVLGLCGSLFVRRRRWWVRASTGTAGRTLVEVAGLDRNDSTDLGEELDDLVGQLQRSAPPSADQDLPSAPGAAPGTVRTGPAPEETDR